MQIGCRIAVLTALAITTCTAARAAATAYQVTALPALPGDPESFADTVSPNGAAGGTSIWWDDQDNIYDVPTIWQNGQAIQLPVPAGQSAAVTAINSQGHAIGTLQLQSGDQGAIAWQNGQMQSLDNLGLPNVIPTGINDSGVIVGFGFDLGSGIQEALTWANGNASVLGSYTAAWGINNAGQILATGSQNGDTVWYLLSGNAAVPITPPAGTLMAGRYLDQAGDVAGDIYNPDSQTNQAFLWSGGVFTVLPSLPGDTLEIAYGVNDSGMAVGLGGTDESYSTPLIW